MVLFEHHRAILVSQFLYTWSVGEVILITVQRDTRQSSLFIYYSASSLYVFRVSTTPMIRSTQICNYSLRYWSYFLCRWLPPTWPRWREVAAQYNMTSTGGCIYSFVYSGWHPKHLQWTWRIINWLLCVASRWTIINIDQWYTEP